MGKIESKTYQRLLDVLEAGVVVLESDLTIRFWNDWLAASTNISSADAAGKKLDDLFPEVPRGSLMRHMKATLSLESAMFFGELKDGALIKIPLVKVLNPAFTNMQQSVTLLPFDIQNSLVAVVIGDQTFLIEAQYALEDKIAKINELQTGYINIIDNQVLMLKADNSGTITYATTAFKRLVQMPKGDILGERLQTFLESGVEEAGGEDEELRDRIKKGRAWEGEVRKGRKEGGECWLTASLTAARNHEGEVMEYAVIMQDITDKKHLERISRTDFLTKVNNRKSFDEILENQIRLAYRYNFAFSVAMFDIDHFKVVNDNFGHQSGDRVLVEMSEVVVSQIRDTDHLGRWGGEEFMVIFPYVALKDLHHTVEKIRRRIESHVFPDVNKVTASFGATAYRKDDTVDTIVERVDKALYKSKEEGRNRVTVF